VPAQWAGYFGSSKSRHRDALIESGGGLCSYAHRWMYCDEETGEFLLDYLLYTDRLYEGLSELLGVAITPENHPPTNAAQQNHGDVSALPLGAHYDADMAGWVNAADREQRALGGWSSPFADMALADLTHMRSQEGTNLLSDMTDRLKQVRNLLGKIKGRIPHAVQGHYDRMKGRVQKLLGNEPQSQDRLHQELAVFADRCDVTEELTRLQSHLAQFHKSIRGKRSMGRRLDFL